MSTLNFKICKSEFFQTHLGAIQEHLSSYAMSLTISFVFPYGLVAAGALFFFLLPSSRASRKMPRSPRLAHEAPVMQATVLLHSRKQSASVTGTFSRPEGVLVPRSSTVVYF